MLRFSDEVPGKYQLLIFLICFLCGTVAYAQVPRFAYVANPYDYTISGFYLNKDGVMFPNGMVFTKDKYPATLAIDPAGQYLYSASRTVDTAPIFKIDPVTGWLTETPQSRFDTHLRSPFSYGFHPSGKFLYIAGRGGGVAGFEVNKQNGELKFVPGSPFKAGERTRCLTVHPSGKFVYASNAYTNNISAYRVDQKTGTLKELSSSPIPGGEAGPFDDTFAKLPDVVANKGGMPYYIASHPGGKFVYATNWAAASVSVFRVNQQTGDLTLVGLPKETGLTPYAVAVHPSGKYVMVSTWGGNDVYVYSVDPNSGQLTHVEGSPFATLGRKPVDITFSKNGKLAYVTNNDSNSVSIFDVDVATGKLTLKDIGMTRAGSIDVELLSSEKPLIIQPKYAFVLDKDNQQLISYHINLNGGDLSEVSRIKTGRQPSAIAQDPRNRFVYVANAGSDNVSAYAIDQKSGALNEVEGSPYAVGKKPGHITVDANGWYLYTLNQESQDISVFLIHVKKGQLAEAQGSPLAVGKQPMDLVNDPTSRFVYVNNAKDKSVNVYRFRTAITPSIFEITDYGSPFIFEDMPSVVAVDPTGRFAMVASGVTDRVSMFFVHVATGALIPIENNLEPYQLQGKGAADAVFHPDGKFVYVMNAKSHSISQLEMDRFQGQLSAIAKPIATKGKPVSLSIDPSGHYLYVVNKGHNGLQKFNVDPATGRLSDAGQVVLPFVPADMAISREFM